MFTKLLVTLANTVHHWNINPNYYSVKPKTNSTIIKALRIFFLPRIPQ